MHINTGKRCGSLELDPRQPNLSLTLPNQVKLDEDNTNNSQFQFLLPDTKYTIEQGHCDICSVMWNNIHVASQ